MNDINSAYKYVNDVLTDKKVVGKYIKLLCERFVMLYENGKDYGIYFDEKKAKHNLQFFDFIRHHKGPAGSMRKSLELSDWQSFAQAYTFGFYREQKSLQTNKNKRLVNDSYIEVAKKNGKTTLAAGNSCYMLIADNEAGAECFIAAPSFDQANIAFKDCTQFIQGSVFAPRCEILKKTISYKNSFIRPVSSEPKYLEGKFAHFGLLDELHEHRDEFIYENLKSGSAARDNPIIYMITTAGYNRDSFCYKKRKSVISDLEGISGFENSSFDTFGAIYTIDEEDDYENPEIWIKSNPQLGLSLEPSFISNQIASIRNDPSRFVPVMTKHLNIWCDSPKSFIKKEDWDKCELIFDIHDFAGCKVYAGLDLSMTDDLTAYVLFIEKEGRIYIYPRFFIPRKKAKEYFEQKVFNFLGFEKNKFVYVTESVQVDYDAVVSFIKADRDFFDYQILCCDPWNAQVIAKEISEILGSFYDVAAAKYINRFLLVKQNYENRSPAMKYFYSEVIKHNLIQNGNPVLSWCIRNTQVKKDWHDNWAPTKDSDSEKIDGTLGCVMAMRGYMIMNGVHSDSVYNERGIMTI